MEESLSSQRARIGALAKAAKYDGLEATRAARAKAEIRWYDATDPSLPEAERLRRADIERRLFFTRLAYASAKARAKRK